MTVAAHCFNPTCTAQLGTATRWIADRVENELHHWQVYNGELYCPRCASELDQ